MEIEEKPVPTEARHRTLGPSAGQEVLMLSEEMPLRFGPRHWGQSAADAVAASSAAATIKLNFIDYFYHDLPRIHGCIASSFCILWFLLRLDYGGEPHPERLRGPVPRAAATRPGATAGARRAMAGRPGPASQRERRDVPGRRPGSSL